MDNIKGHLGREREYEITNSVERFDQYIARCRTGSSKPKTGIVRRITVVRKRTDLPIILPNAND